MSKYPDTSPTIKLLEFAYKKYIEDENFTAEDVEKEAKLSIEEFHDIKRHICITEDEENYSITQDALFRYLSYRAMKSADSHASRALFVASLAIMISIALGVYQIVKPAGVAVPTPLEVTLTKAQAESLKLPKIVRLEPNQISALVGGFKTAAESLSKRATPTPLEVRLTKEQAAALEPLKSVRLAPDQVSALVSGFKTAAESPSKRTASSPLEVTLTKAQIAVLEPPKTVTLAPDQVSALVDGFKTAAECLIKMNGHVPARSLPKKKNQC